MKYLILAFAGISDEPLEHLDGRTPLEVAETPHFDALANQGSMNRLSWGISSSYGLSDLAAMSLLGYDSMHSKLGRGLWNAHALGLSLSKGDIAFGCQLLTQENDMAVDPLLGDISEREILTLFEGLNRLYKKEGFEFYASSKGHHVMIARSHANKFLNLHTHELPKPDELFSGKIKLSSYQDPKQTKYASLQKLIASSRDYLEQHEVNKVRIDLHENPANQLWLWGASQHREVPSFKESIGLDGVLYSSYDSLKGMAALSQLSYTEVPWEVRVSSMQLEDVTTRALKDLQSKDIAILYLDHAEYAALSGDYRKKIRWIEAYDQYVLKTVIESRLPGARILMTSNHSSLTGSRKVLTNEVPSILCGVGVKSDKCSMFTESAAESSSLKINGSQGLWDALIAKEVVGS